MKSPVIGLTMSRGKSASGNPMMTLSESYIQAVVRAGAVPLLIPLGLSEDMLGKILSKIDGLLFTGGGDVHPEQYGSHTHPKVANVDIDRDRVELFLVREAVDRTIPFLGICRGIQVLNIALGGSIYEDILDQRPGAIKHSYSDEMPRDYLAHPIKIEAGSQLASLLGKTDAKVNSLHHQGINILASGLKASALAPDGLVEAVELSGYPFGLGVQWHPECLPEEAAMDELFRGLSDTSMK